MKAFGWLAPSAKNRSRSKQLSRDPPPRGGEGGPAGGPVEEACSSATPRAVCLHPVTPLNPATPVRLEDGRLAISTRTPIRASIPDGGAPISFSFVFWDVWLCGVLFWSDRGCTSFKVHASVPGICTSMPRGGVVEDCGTSKDRSFDPRISSQQFDCSGRSLW